MNTDKSNAEKFSEQISCGHPYDIDELIELIRKGTDKICERKKSAREYLLSTGMYTKNMKIKKRFKGSK